MYEKALDPNAAAVVKDVASMAFDAEAYRAANASSEGTHAGERAGKGGWDAAGGGGGEEEEEEEEAKSLADSDGADADADAEASSSSSSPSSSSASSEASSSPPPSSASSEASSSPPPLLVPPLPLVPPLLLVPPFLFLFVSDGSLERVAHDHDVVAPDSDEHERHERVEKADEGRRATGAEEEEGGRKRQRDAADGVARRPRAPRVRQHAREHQRERDGGELQVAEHDLRRLVLRDAAPGVQDAHARFFRSPVPLPPGPKQRLRESRARKRAVLGVLRLDAVARRVVPGEGERELEPAPKRHRVHGRAFLRGGRRRTPSRFFFGRIRRILRVPRALGEGAVEEPPGRVADAEDVPREPPRFRHEVEEVAQARVRERLRRLRRVRERRREPARGRVVEADVDAEPRVNQILRGSSGVPVRRVPRGRVPPRQLGKRSEPRADLALEAQQRDGRDARRVRAPAGVAGGGGDPPGALGRGALNPRGRSAMAESGRARDGGDGVLERGDERDAVGAEDVAPGGRVSYTSVSQYEGWDCVRSTRGAGGARSRARGAGGPDARRVCRRDQCSAARTASCATAYGSSRARKERMPVSSRTSYRDWSRARCEVGGREGEGARSGGGRDRAQRFGGARIRRGANIERGCCFLSEVPRMMMGGARGTHRRDG